jgi:hypothetical protein
LWLERAAATREKNAKKRPVAAKAGGSRPLNQTPGGWPQRKLSKKKAVEKKGHLRSPLKKQLKKPTAP